MSRAYILYNRPYYEHSVKYDFHILVFIISENRHFSGKYQRILTKFVGFLNYQQNNKRPYFGLLFTLIYYINLWKEKTFP